MRDIQVGDFVVYENLPERKKNMKSILITTEQVTRVYDETFDSKKRIGLKKFRIKRVKTDYKSEYDYAWFDPERIAEENYGEY